MYDYKIQFKSSPPSTYTGFYNQTPFYIGLTTTDPNYEGLRVNLFSQNSFSSPYQIPQNKWSHLVPQWKFTNSEGKFIEFETPKILETVMGSAYILETSAYYVDDLPANVVLIATLETSVLSLSADHPEVELPSYSNSLIFDTVEYTVLSSELDHIKVTQDGKNKINKFKWTDTYVPFVVTFHPNSALHTNIYELTSFDPILFTTPYELECNVLELSVHTVPNSSVLWNESSSVSLSSYDKYGFPSGGYYKGHFTSQVSSIPATIKANYCDSFFGESNEFQIKKFERPYEMRRFNESWDTGGVIHSYALAEHTYFNPIFFDNFMEVAVGGLESNHQSIGRTMFERIANFVKNHNDIEVSNLNQFYSILDSMDIPYDNYQLSYPSEVERLVDMLSVHKTKLLGSFCKCNRNFFNETLECEFCGHSHDLNRGIIAECDPSQFVVSAGIPFVLENIYSTKSNYSFDLIHPNLQDLNYSLSAYLGDLPSVSWLTSSEYYKYSFYDYVSTFCGVQEEGVVNWSDSFTTLSSSISSLQQWYGDEQIVEEMLNYELHRGFYNV